MAFGRRKEAKRAVSRNATLAETVPRHFTDGVVDGSLAVVPGLDLAIDCEVGDVWTSGDQTVAPLTFSLIGTALASLEVAALATGYGADEESAIVQGGCEWACAFGPVIRAALGGPEPGDEREARSFDAVIDERPYRVFVNHLDRGSVPPTDPGFRAFRTELCQGSWLTATVLEAGGMPPLGEGVSFLCVFVGRYPHGTLAEVKVNGRDWPPSTLLFPEGAGPDGQTTLLRELAALVPAGPVPRAIVHTEPLTRASVEDALHAISPLTDPGQAAGWPGWQSHGGRLDAPLTDFDLSLVERRTGPLPDEYRSFLTQVAAAGAGPGYGLLGPALQPDGASILLARGGCGVTWSLRLDEPHRGVVCADSAGVDGGYRQVAATFDEWYRAWLEHSRRGKGPWLHWDATRCSTPALVARLLLERRTGEAKEMVGIRVMSSDGGLLDPCHSCVRVAACAGLPDSIFQRPDPSR